MPTPSLKSLGRSREKPIPELLSELLSEVSAGERPDCYGAGETIGSFEKEVADLLGKPAAVFMPSGTMAQVIALRIHSELKRNPRIALHATSHLELHEHQAYFHLHGLARELIGEASREPNLLDFQALREKPSVALFELPTRELGGVLLSWDELLAISAWAKTSGVSFHLDGARLWECAPHYRRPYDEIAALFDTVYVSFYKGLGGLAGAVLAGPKSFIETARIWMRRQGGNLVTLFPYVLSARRGLRTQLPKMRSYYEMAIRVAGELHDVPGVEVVPREPKAAMMHVYLRGDLDRLEKASGILSASDHISLFRRLRPVPERPGWAMFELSVGDSTLEWEPGEVSRAFRKLMSGCLFPETSSEGLEGRL